MQQPADQLPRGTAPDPRAPLASEPAVEAVAAAARIIGISRSRVYEALCDGSLPSLKIGRRRLIRCATLRAYVAALEAKGAAT